MSAKRAINGKLQGSVATYLKCGMVVTNQVKKSILLSESKKIKSVKIRQICKQKCGRLMHFVRLANWTEKVHETITFLLVTLPNIHRFKKKITDRLSNKPF